MPSSSPSCHLILGTIAVVGYSSILQRAAAHPLCYFDSRPTDYNEVLSFCPEQENGACCNDLEEGAIIAVFEASGIGLSSSCADHYKQVICGPCYSYSGHFFERLGSELGASDGMTMKAEFCDSFVAACEGELIFPTYDGEDYCTKHQGGGSDLYWSYPYTEPDIVDAGLTPLFDEVPSDPISMHMSPDGSVWWIAGLEGQILEVDASSFGSGSTVLDLTGLSEFHVSYEEGLLSFAFSPAFDSNGRFYVVYTAAYSGNVHNRLSRFDYTGTAASTLASQEILIETSAKTGDIHSAGWCGFKPSAYGSSASSHELFWSIGDSGPQLDTGDHGQNPDDLHSTIVRILVPTTGTGYSIPSGNYDGGLPEICAIGFRNPYRCAFDKETDDLYCGDVGHVLVESVDKIECGNNYGWPRFEGSRCLDEVQDRFGPCDGASRTGFEFPIFEYCHPDYYSDVGSEEPFTAGLDICGDRIITGNAIIGGHIYRGQYFSEVLTGAYIFADYESKDIDPLLLDERRTILVRFDGRLLSVPHLQATLGTIQEVDRMNIYYIVEEGGDWKAGTIVSDGSLAVVAFAEDNNGELYILASNDNIYAMPCADLCLGTCLPQADEVPVFESLGCYGDESEDRALTLQMAPSCDVDSKTMSPTICAAYCATVEDATLFGVQFSSECFCGTDDDDYGKHGSLPDEDCSSTCTGTPDEFCGGFQAIEASLSTSHRSVTLLLRGYLVASLSVASCVPK